jgi:hypothetical protein
MGIGQRGDRNGGGDGAGQQAGGQGDLQRVHGLLRFDFSRSAPPVAAHMR